MIIERQRRISEEVYPKKVSNVCQAALFWLFDFV